MSQAERIVGVLLQEEDAEEFMRDVDFEPGGQMLTLHNMDLVKDELNDFSRAVIRRTAQIMPELVKRGICREDQSAIVAKLLSYYLAELHYNPKRWHEQWQKAAKRIFRYLPGNVSWTGGMSSLTRD
ncbi:MAG: hypothetical protein ACOYB3_00295 [Azonexus sp.]